MLKVFFWEYDLILLFKEIEYAAWINFSIYMDWLRDL